MGGMIAYYLSTQTTHINRLIPVISTPDFCFQSLYQMKQLGIDSTVFFDPKRHRMMDAMNPAKNIDKMTYQSLHIFSSEDDQTIPFRPTIHYYKGQQQETDSIHVY